MTYELNTFEIQKLMQFQKEEDLFIYLFIFINIPFIQN